jgi:MinD-like ATPase involved in chromosome partitioning or flagellar assembly
MSKLISVWGSPNSGKTTLSVKLAEYLYRIYKASVIVVFADYNVPSLPIIFASDKNFDFQSVGNALSKTEITEQEALKNINTIKGKMNFGFIGYKQGENKFTYPEYSAEKATAFLNVLKHLVDIVIVDCTSNLEEALSTSAIKMADTIFRLGLPDLKSISYFSSVLPLYSDPSYRLSEHITVLNQIEKEPIKEINKADSFYGKVKYILPYSNEVKQQGIEGLMINRARKKDYVNILKTLAETVV